MLETLRWLLVVEFISLATLPVALRAFPNLSDRGWGLSRPLGLIILGTVTWLLSYARVIPNSPIGWWAAVGAIAAASAAMAYGDRAQLLFFVRTRWRLLVAGELVFLIAFAAIALFRAFNPNIEATEKPMELMLLNSAVVTSNAPPGDAWLSGHPVSYYYFGYWMLGGLSTMAGVATEYAFNLSLALISGAGAAAMFTLASSLVRRDGASYRSSILAGTAAAFILLFVATLAGWWELAGYFGIVPSGLLEWLQIDGLANGQASAGWRPDQHWWWFRASRVINSFSESGSGLDFTIEEFPAFSLILGDLHPHVISIPFVLTGIGVAANVHFSRERWGIGWINSNRWPAAAGVLVIGASGFVNAWDVLFVASLMLGVAAFKTMRERASGLPMAIARAAPAVLLICIAAILVYSPYYIGTLESQVQSPPIGPVRQGTRLVHFLTVWGGLFLLAAPFVAVILKKALAPQIDQSRLARFKASPGTAAPWSAWKVGAGMVGVPYFAWLLTHLTFNVDATATDGVTRLMVAGPLALLFVSSLATLAWRSSRGASDSTQFVLILAALISYMLFWVELFFVHDLFGNRMNTMFKLYYEAWIAVALIAGFGTHAWMRLHRRLTGRALVASRTAAVVAAVLAIGPIYYPVAAAATRVDEYGGKVTLDGLAWLAERSPDEYAAIQWLRANADGQPVIAEAVGGSYSESGRISEATGLPAVIGWTGHENQWRSDSAVFAGREQDVRELYETSDGSRAGQIVGEYDITFVVVGDRERSTYAGIDVSKFDTLGDRVFEQGAVVIYRLQ